MTAKVFTVFNQKGGSGKTEVSMQLAGTLGFQGARVLVIEMDPQGTATRWAAQAPDGKPFPAQVVNQAPMEGKIHREIKTQIENYDFIIVDCPPAISSPAPSSAMLVSDLALIPVVPSPGDLWAAVAAKELAARAQLTNESLLVRVIPNMVQKGLKLTIESMDVMRDDGDAPVTAAWLGLRSAFKECQLLGTTVHGVRGARDAIAEVEALVDEVLAVVGLKPLYKGRKA